MHIKKPLKGQSEMLMVYGLKNCDTCRKATAWLVAENIPHIFHDVCKDGVDRTMIKKWAKGVGWDILLNRRGTTWRNLSASDKDGIDEAKATELMSKHPALIKRPVCDQNGKISIGFKEVNKAMLIL
jgi:Spx/MgsR family transcriptional regulator